MRRRELLAGLLATTAATGMHAAEPNRVHRLAAVGRTMDDFSRRDRPWGSLLDHLRKRGYIEGTNLILERYAAEGRAERYLAIARDMVRQKPDVIVLALNHQLIFEIARETYPIPVVALMGDPVAAGLVKNLARPEGNITGIAGDAGIEMQGKHLEILRRAFLGRLMLSKTDRDS